MINEPIIDEMPVRNSIFIIEPYRVGANGWAFDDASVGLFREAFVSGADSLLDIISEGRDKVLIIFSSNEFPGYTLKIDKTDNGGANSGTWYYAEKYQLDLWLCGALNLYYPKSPDFLYLQIK